MYVSAAKPVGTLPAIAMEGAMARVREGGSYCVKSRNVFEEGNVEAKDRRWGVGKSVGSAVPMLGKVKWIVDD